MSLDYSIKSNSGDVINVTPNDVAQEFLGKGYKSASVTPDGTTLHVADADGHMAQIDLAQFLGHNAQQVGFSPSKENVNYDTVDGELARKLELIGNDETSRQLLLKSQLGAKGINDAKIVGKGDDYYYFDPKTNKYNALTNKPGMDMSDFHRAIPGIASGIGAIGGGLAGAAGGAGLLSIPAAGLGAAGGGMAMRNLMRMTEGQMDPEFDKVLRRNDPTWDEIKSGNLRPETKNYLSEEGHHAAVDGIAGMVGNLPIPFLQSGLNNGIASRAAQGVGKLAEVGGGAVKGATDYLAGPGGVPSFAREMIAQASPLGPIKNAAWLAQAGELAPMAVRGAGKGAEKFGQMLDGQAYNASLRGSSEEALASPALRDKIWNFSQRAKGKALAPEAEEGLAQSAERNYNNFFSSKAGEATTSKPIAGVSNANIEQTIANLARGNGAEASLNKLGQGLQTASNLGKATDKGIDRLVRGGLNTVGGVANVAKQGGKVLNRVGRVTAPLENRALLQYGNEELPQYFDRRRR